MQSGGLSLLTAVDRLGNTPQQCAENSGHRMLAHFLRVQERKLTIKAMPTSKIWLRLQGLYFAPVIWAATLFCIWSFHFRVLRSADLSVPMPLPWMSALSMLSILTSGIGLVLMALLNASDPGFVPQRGQRGAASGRRKSGDEHNSLTELSSIENLDCPALWAGRWEQLCVTCKIVRPLRAKHEENAGRCIEVRCRCCHCSCCLCVNNIEHVDATPRSCCTSASSH